MNCNQIFKELKKKQININYFFNRELITIRFEDFKKYQKYFSKPIKIGNKDNFRTKDKFKHIHAVKSNNLVEIHFDYGNLYQNYLLSIPHLFLDVIPYFTWHIITWKKPYKIIKK